MKLTLLIAFCFGLFVPIFSQVDDVKLAEAQKILKKRLMNDTPYVNRVKFDGCRVAIRTGGGSFWSPMPSAGVASRTGYFNDPASFSTGPDELMFSRPSNESVLDLSLLDITKIVPTSIPNRKLSRMVISDKPSGVVTVKHVDPMMAKFNGTDLVIVVKEKSTDKTLMAFKDIAEICRSKKTN